MIDSKKSFFLIVLKNGLRLSSILFAVSVISFILMTASPVNPVQQYILGLDTAVSAEQRAEIEDYWGIHEPPLERYLSWLGEVGQGHFGESILFKRPVLDIIVERFTNSFGLMLLGWIFSGVLGFGLGCLMGMFQNKLLDKVLTKLCYILSSIPTFWFGLLTLLIFGSWLHWFPIGFSSPIGITSDQVSLGQRLTHLILPTMTLTFLSFSNIALHTRQKLIEVLNSEFVLFARARGESEWTILKRHGIRNILFPALTLQFSSFAELFGGSVMAENVFSYPGLGTAVTLAGLKGDVPLLLGITLFSTLFVCFGNLIANILYGIIDPKIVEKRL